MWFIRLGKMTEAPTKEFQQWVNQKRAEGEKWGIKFHEVFITLGQFDVVSIFEAPDEKVAMRYSQSLAPRISGPTLVGLSRDEVFSWYK